MAQKLRVCIDRVVPPPLLKERLALVKDASWGINPIINVMFMNGDPATKKRVEKQAQEWTNHANVTLIFGDDPEADIRISFHLKGSWSYIGKQAKKIATTKPTMNYGWLTSSSTDEEVRRVVLHEFGHALGCIHEHQNPAGGIQWNKPAVYKYFAGPPNKWSPEQVETNLFKPYDADLTVHTALDRDSIMMYPIPKAFTLDGFEIAMNKTLSATDIAFIAEQYP